MSPEHGSIFELVKALRELGAVHVRVDGFECRFDPHNLLPLEIPRDQSGEVAELRAQLRRVKRMVGDFDGDSA